MNEKYDYFAPTSLGIEPLLVQELQALGLDHIKATRAGVEFQGTLEDGYRACLWSRTANRILLVLGSFRASSPEELYEGVKKIDWSDHLTLKTTFAVDFSSAKSKITHTQYGALKTKDAIVDQFRDRFQERPSVEVNQPNVRVNVYIFEDTATVTIDLSGDSLHRRGYRLEGASAPLKENLAAALLMQAGWAQTAAPHSASLQEGSFVDPMCGSGTLPIEAALMAMKSAPGFHRHYFGFQGWQGHVPKTWKRVLEEAEEIEIKDPKKIPKIVGYDIDPKAVRIALANRERAGLDKVIHIEQRPFSEARSLSEKGIVVVNPPFGERLGDVEKLRGLYGELGDTFKNHFKGWQAFLFTGSKELSQCVGLKATRRSVFFHGPIECRLLKYDLY